MLLIPGVHGEKHTGMNEKVAACNKCLTDACVPFRIQNVQQLLSIHLLGGCEYHHLKQLRNPFQEFCQKRSLPHSNGMVPGVELDCECEVCCITAIQRRMHLQYHTGNVN